MSVFWFCINELLSQRNQPKPIKKLFMYISAQQTKKLLIYRLHKKMATMMKGKRFDQIPQRSYSGMTYRCRRVY